MVIDRRNFLKVVAAAGAAAALPPFSLPSAAVEAPGSFDFAFVTDTHIEPELDAAHGCDMCFRKVASLKPEFTILGGDHVYDALEVPSARSISLFDLYQHTAQLLGTPVYHTVGNHDIFGLYTKSGVAPDDPHYGKKMFRDLFGPTYYSFDHKGYHFIVLDSIQPTEDRLYRAAVDDEQIRWLADDLRKTGNTMPVIVAVHCPMVTGFATFAPKTPPGKYNTLIVDNTPDILPLFDGHNVLAVLQGHTHINEVVNYRGIQFITSGAVCGNWWHGLRLGTPEGFTMVSLREGKVQTRYETYGFHSVDPREKF
jgi:Icc protein